MDAVSQATALPRPGRRRHLRARAHSARTTSGSRQSVLSRGGLRAWSAVGSGMVTKTQKVELGLGLPEKKKKKKKKKKMLVGVVKDPQTQYSALNSNDYFVDVSPRATSPSNDTDKEQVPEMPLGKNNKKKKGHSTLFEDLPEPEPIKRAERTGSPSPRNQVLDYSEYLSGEKKKKRATQSLGTKTSPDPKQGEEVSKAARKLKKHKKEKKAPNAAAFSPQDSWRCEAGDALHPCSRRTEADEQAALGQKRKQRSPREHSIKKKKKTHQEGDALPVPSKLACCVDSSPMEGRKKKPVKDEVLEYIPIDSSKASRKKKVKSKKKAERLVGEGLAVKRKKRRRKESKATDDPWEVEEEEEEEEEEAAAAAAAAAAKEESDTDLEVVLEKKGNMDEACIDQVRRKALQEEIDRESGKTEASEPRKWTGTRFGQWDTAGFENEEQKLKFLKLMGGFKHLSPSFSRPPSMTGRPNMALDKKSADTLQQNLQQDYDRAMSWKNSRGAGLGFSSAAADKIFYIDRNASKSIKLQD